MKKIFFISFFAAMTAVSFAQNIERKIIVDHGRYYFTTINDEFQVGTLCTGKYTDALKTAKKLALPAGRNFSDPIIPFSWDVDDTNLYAINFLMHPLNDRNEAIKRMNISSLKEWGPDITVLNMIMLGTDMNPYAYNDPYEFVIKRSNILENFFFDGIAVNDTSYCVAISNKGEMSIWNYNGKAWKHGDVQKFAVDGFFSLVSVNKKLYIVLNNGTIHEIRNNKIDASIKKDLHPTLSDGFVIVNKDNNSVQYLKNDQLDQSTPLNELIQKKAVNVF